LCCVVLCCVVLCCVVLCCVVLCCVVVLCCCASCSPCMLCRAHCHALWTSYGLSPFDFAVLQALLSHVESSTAGGGGTGGWMPGHGIAVTRTVTAMATELRSASLEHMESVVQVRADSQRLLSGAVHLAPSCRGIVRVVRCVSCSRLSMALTEARRRHASGRASPVDPEDRPYPVVSIVHAVDSLRWACTPLCSRGFMTSPTPAVTLLLSRTCRDVVLLPLLQ
jgi:hypothetical protein